MIFKYGNHTHPANEVNLTTVHRQAVMNERGFRTFNRETMVIEGELLYDTQATLKTRIDELEAAYSENGRDAILFHDDGTTPSSHKLLTATSVGGVIVKSVSFPSGDPDQYATTRTFQIVLEALYDAIEGSNQLVSFFESIQFLGATGPRYRHREIFNGPARVQTLNSSTVQRIVQAGQSVGTAFYRPQEPPILPKQPVGGTIPLLDLWREEVLGPESFRGTFRNYPRKWRYVWSSQTDQSGSLRPNL